MNPTLVKRALEKIPNCHVLVNVVSRRVRQLTSRERGPMVADTANLGAADIALLEIINGAMSIEMPDFIPLTRPTRNGNRPKNWARA